MPSVKKHYWRKLIDDLLQQKLIIQTKDRFPLLIITKYGKEVLQGETNLFTFQRPDQTDNNKVELSTDFNNELLYNVIGQINASS